MNMEIVRNWEEERKRLEIARANIDLQQVEQKLKEFNEAQFKSNFSQHAQTRGVEVKWVDENYEGGFTYTTNIRHEDNFGIDHNVKTAEELFNELIKDNDDESRITAWIHKLDETSGCADHMLFYAFGHEILSRAVDNEQTVS